MEFIPGIADYIETLSSAEDPVLRQLNRDTHANVIYPRMLSGHIQGKFLEFISYLLNPLRILEIGTYTGYSAICLARGLRNGGKLITIEKNDELADFPGKYFKKAGVADRIDHRIGDAAEIIPALNELFDLVFIDAEKKDYLLYYELVIDKVRPGGFILADNVLWDGKVLDPKKYTDKETEGIIRFNAFIKEDSRVENVIVPLRDGISLIRKN